MSATICGRFRGISTENVLVGILTLLMTLHILAPNLTERKLFLNEFFAVVGVFYFFFKHKIERRLPTVLVYFYLLFLLGLFHAILSIFRSDNYYFYIRNSVMFYSMFTFFIGYIEHQKIIALLVRSRNYIKYILLPCVFLPLPFLDRFSFATIFPLFVLYNQKKWTYAGMTVLCFIYSFTYSSATAVVLCLFFGFMTICNNPKIFGYVTLGITIVFCLVFAYLIPYLDITKYGYSYSNAEQAIHSLMRSHILLDIDGNTTWRLVLWRQVLIDKFPANLLGLGFGTRLIEYFPIDSYDKIASLPYVMGAHNSFIYVFGRLGLPAFLLTVLIIINVFKSFFKYQYAYIQQNTHWVFLSFFTIIIISLFNPTLESPIYAGIFWFIFGLVTKSIVQVQKNENSAS